MKIRTKYYCEYCGKEFETEASCQAHEERHALELNIIDKNYIEVREFPDIIKIITPTFSDFTNYYTTSYTNYYN
jgi:hypothetical protein